MADYKKMYYELADAISKATDLLIEAAQQAEEIYIRTDDEQVLSLLTKEAEEALRQDESQHD